MPSKKANVKNEKQYEASLIDDGARREGRTPTLLREPDFESGASASSAIRASLPQEHVFLA